MRKVKEGDMVRVIRNSIDDNVDERYHPDYNEPLTVAYIDHVDVYVKFIEADTGEDSTWHVREGYYSLATNIREPVTLPDMI